MITMNIVIREDLKVKLEKEFVENGIRYSETIRRALDKYFEDRKND